MEKSVAAVVCLLAGCMLAEATPAWALTVEQEAMLLASDAESGDAFGRSVALSGDTVVVGASWDDHAGGTDAGSAYVFVRNGTSWSEQAKLTASDPADTDHFGQSVALSGDTALVGAPFDDDVPVGSGSAYVFVRIGTMWTEQAKLTASDAGFGDAFGTSLALSGDTAVVGASGAAQTAYVFVRSGTTWTEQARLTASDAAANDFFATSVALSDDTVVVGAPNDDQPGGADAGSAYVFVRSGTTWTEQAKLTASDGGLGDNFGHAMAVSSNTAVVGSRWDDEAEGTDVGSAYVFARSGTTWTEQAKLKASDAAAIDQFGGSVALLGDTAVVGAPGPAQTAYVFVRSGTTWTEQAKLTASDAELNDTFGRSVALSDDTVVVGAVNDDNAGGENAGSAYVFRLYDDDVPATGVVGTALLLTTVLGTGVYFMRRRATG